VAGTTDAQRSGVPLPVVVHWTEDMVRSSRVDPKVAHYSEQAEIDRAVTAGCDAYDDGRPDEAAEEWGRAVRLAAESGNAEILERMRRLVSIRDAAGGVVTIKPGLQPLDLRRAAVGSNLSTRRQASHEGAGRVPGPAGPDLTCPACGRVSPAGARYCACGQPLGERDTPDGGPRR
jgi:hypothetical protein